MATKNGTSTAPAVARKSASKISSRTTKPVAAPNWAVESWRAAIVKAHDDRQNAVARGFILNRAEEESDDPHDTVVMLMGALQDNPRFNELCDGLVEHYPPAPSVETAGDSPHFHLRLFAARLFRAGQLAENAKLFRNDQTVTGV